MTPLRLKWERTWPDRENDFTAKIGEHSLRIYRDDTSPEFRGQFYWVANREAAIGSGHATTAREAAVAAEACYFGDTPIVAEAAPAVASSAQ